MKRIVTAVAIAIVILAEAWAEREMITFKEGWEFTKGRPSAATKWQSVSVPHDWAIYGPFDRKHDLQIVAIEQNGEVEKTEKTGRTGGLPFIGQGTYRRHFEIADTAGRNFTLVFDGAMSNAHVKINGLEVAYWPYGYNSFYTDITKGVKPGNNELIVELENFEKASRWYPGAGLYRNVHLFATDKIHVPVWGTYITTPYIGDKEASVRLEMEIAGLAKNEKIEVLTDILSPEGKVVASNRSPYIAREQKYTQNFLIENPQLWSLNDPNRYTARTQLLANGKVLDIYSTRFGIRKLDYLPEKGFFLNGVPTKFRGVCNHHDLGPLGAAVNKAALLHQVELLKDMGVNAIRTSHNMPAPELVEICDSLGVMLMVEPFDDWGFRPKSPNGYGAFFKEWAERDITNMMKHYRNSPSIVMWSIGNEVPSQWGPDGMSELVMLRDLVRSLDSTRPITCGMDNINAVLSNGFAAALDIPGFNYKPDRYKKAYEELPQRMILGSETASTVSSRGVYHFPADFPSQHHTVLHSDNQSSSYDNETCSWSNTPDIDFYMDEQPWVLGQFVWTGFDYLGEPSPYDTNAWPNHSSVFGIIDLASLPKDRYWLYRSQWNKEQPTLHILPHWNWAGREGEITPIFVYTSYPKAELFINGKSQGVREKNDSTLQTRYRLMWNETRYTPGEVRVVAYDSIGNKVAEKSICTAGKSHHLVATSNRGEIKADGEDLAYITIQVADKDGNIVPTDSRRVKFSVRGAGKFEATANGDPKCLLPFQNPEMDLFSGAATLIVKAGNTPGDIIVEVKSEGVRPAKLIVPAR